MCTKLSGRGWSSGHQDRIKRYEPLASRWREAVRQRVKLKVNCLAKLYAHATMHLLPMPVMAALMINRKVATRTGCSRLKLRAASESIACRNTACGASHLLFVNSSSEPMPNTIALGRVTVCLHVVEFLHLWPLGVAY